MPYQGGRDGGGFRGRGDRDSGFERNPDQMRKLFVGGLSYDTDEKGLRGHFDKFGEISDCVIMRDPHTKRSRGFGFITFSTEEGIDQAQKDRPHNIDGREIESKRAMPKEETGSQQTIMKMFIGGIKEDIAEKDVRDLFEQFGEIDQIDYITDKATGKPRGFCFVTFKDYDPVDKCVLIKRHKINGHNVEVKKALSKEEMNRSGGGGGWGGSSRGGRGDYGGGRGGGGGRYEDRGGYGRDRDSYGYGRDRDSGFDRGYDSRSSGYDRGYDRGGYASRDYDAGYGSRGGDSYGSSSYDSYGGGSSGGGYGSSSGGGAGGYSSGGGGGGYGGGSSSYGSTGYGGSSSYQSRGYGGSSSGGGGGYSSGGGGGGGYGGSSYSRR